MATTAMRCQRTIPQSSALKLQLMRKKSKQTDAREALTQQPFLSGIREVARMSGSAAGSR